MNKERFESKVNKTNTCWVWTGKLNTYGYGYFMINYVQYRAHRYAYNLYIGPIENNLCVLHRCDNPACVNPAHLFLGTQADNMRDKIQKGRLCTHGSNQSLIISQVKTQLNRRIKIQNKTIS